MTALSSTLVNGQICETISVQDRGFLYGDGVFETIRVQQGRMVLWTRHCERLVNSCRLLDIALDLRVLKAELQSLLDNISSSVRQGIVKIIVSRGAGGRGYRPTLPAGTTTRVVQFFELDSAPTKQYQQGIEVLLCRHRISSNDSLSGLKHLNRLDQVVASRELGERFLEGIVMDSSSQIIEGTRSNLFLVHNEKLITPRLNQAGVAGTMRAYLLDKFAADAMAASEQIVLLDDLCEASELFLCNSVYGIWPVSRFHEQGNVHSFTIGPYISQALNYQDEIFSADD